MSNYDDPRWYEQPDNRFTPESGDQFIPTSTTYINNSMQQQTSSKEPEPDSKRQVWAYIRANCSYSHVHDHSLSWWMVWTPGVYEHQFQSQRSI